jgi:uncharacterized RDD family membrane protein YckC
MQPQYNVPSTQVKADPGTRFLAALIDGLVGYVPFFILSMISLKLAILGWLLILGYSLTKDALPEVGGFLGGQSIGKKLMNIKVIKEDTGQGIVGERKRFGDKWEKTIVVKA